MTADIIRLPDRAEAAHIAAEDRDWPDPAVDPGFYHPASLEDWRDDRDQLEAATIAATLQASRTVREHVLDELGAEAFHYGRWRTLWETIEALSSDREDVTIGSILDRLDALHGGLEHVGGIDAVVKLADLAFVDDPLMLARLVVEWSRRERMRNYTATLPDKVKLDGDLDPEEVADRLRQLQRTREHGIDTVDAVWDGVIERIGGAGDHGWQAGWPEFDKLYRPEPGLWTVLTGVPGAGKSTWLESYVLRLCARHDLRVAFFSPEQAPSERLVELLVRQRLNVPPRTASSDTLDEAYQWLADHVDAIRSTDGVTVTEVIRRADVLWRRNGLDGLVIDPWNELDRSDVSDRQSETLRISESLSHIRRWARKREVHVWVVAHPTKVEKHIDGTYKRPTLYDIAHSATWRDKADFGLVAHREDPMGGSATEVHVAKVRFSDAGQQGRCDFTVDPDMRKVGPTSTRGPM